MTQSCFLPCFPMHLHGLMRWLFTSIVLWSYALIVNIASEACATSCNDCQDSWQLERGAAITINSQLDCVSQFGQGSHAYIRNVTVAAMDDSKLIVTFTNASDAPIAKTSNVCYFDFARPIAKNALHSGDVAISITCNNYWAPCAVRTRVAFACFVPCCYTKEDTSDKPQISCVDGSTRTAFTTGRSVGYVDEESIKFVDVPQCPSAENTTPSPMTTESSAPQVRCWTTYEVGTATTGETGKLLPRSKAMVCSAQDPTSPHHASPQDSEGMQSM